MAQAILGQKYEKCFGERIPLFLWAIMCYSFCFYHPLPCFVILGSLISALCFWWFYALFDVRNVSVAKNVVTGMPVRNFNCDFLREIQSVCQTMHGCGWTNREREWRDSDCIFRSERKKYITMKITENLRALNKTRSEKKSKNPRLMTVLLMNRS